uniref:Uncharacterized protein n=1 Tax=Spongospora subterranea TaxID=70186 RepID=A0A0H5RF12_9EUKA|eukprot:CRZ07218.1 hypothetical protein [Spongospora subterranea]
MMGPNQVSILSEIMSPSPAVVFEMADGHSGKCLRKGLFFDVCIENPFWSCYCSAPPDMCVGSPNPEVVLGGPFRQNVSVESSEPEQVIIVKSKDVPVAVVFVSSLAGCKLQGTDDHFITRLSVLFEEFSDVSV